MNPVLVNVWRGNAVESRHRGAVSVVRADGQQVFSIGDEQHKTFPRSAIKFIQAIPFVESGALEHYRLSAQHLSLACASHNGEPAHAKLIESWLSAIGCAQTDLECGADLPMHQATRHQMLAEHKKPQRVLHNCSGKHLGMLSTCCKHGDELQGYRLYEHPAQRRWFSVLEQLADVQVAELPWGYDGCGIPCLALPLKNTALAMARFADAGALQTTRRDAVERIQSAITAYPYMVAGKDRLCTAMMEQLAPHVLLKTGAEGCYTACLPQQGIGIALKMDDGRGRAAEVAMCAVLKSLDVLDGDKLGALANYIEPALRNSRDDVIGKIAASDEWHDVSVKN